MSVLNIDDRGIKVPVIELGTILSKQQVVLGHYERDLILRTAGNIKVQVGNKFYNLPFSTDDVTTTEGPIVDGNKVTILDSLTDLDSLPYPGDGSFIYVRESGGFYIAINGGYIQLNTQSGQVSKVYLSFTETQNLTGEEKYQVTLNTGTTLIGINQVSSLQPQDVYDGQVIFDISTGKYYQLKDRANSTLVESWEELFLSLTQGGVLQGDVYLDQSKLHFHSDYKQSNLPLNEENFDGVFFGEDDYSQGLGIWRTENEVIFSNQSDSVNGFKFITRGSTGNPYEPLNIYENRVGVGGPVDFNYILNVTGLSQFRNKSVFAAGIKSPEFTSGPSGNGYDISIDSEGKWTLEIDKIITRDSSEVNTSRYKTTSTDGNLIVNFSCTLTDVDEVERITVNIDGTKAGRYSTLAGAVMPLQDKSSFVEVTRIPIANLRDDDPIKATELFNLGFGIGDRKADGSLVDYNTYIKNENGVIISYPGIVNIDNITVYEVIPNATTDSFVVGDLLLYREWTGDKDEIKGIYVEVVDVGETTIIVYAYNNSILNVGTTLIKIGNRYDQECFLQLNGADTNSPYLEVVNDIDSFNDYIENVYYDPNEQEITREIETNAFRKDQVRVRMGHLNKITDSDLSLSGSLEQGFYSDNAYVKGNFVSRKHIMGDQLSFINNVLTIKDLETFKTRNIIVSDGLNGGGNLYTANVLVKHNPKTWVDKTGLTGGQVISNINVDAYGHPTNWTTRTLTTTDIIEGDRLYYTDVRADARITLQKGQANGLTPLDSGAKIDTIYLPDSILGAVRYQGTYDIATNSPTLPSPTGANKGFYFIVEADGSYSGIDYKTGDWIISNGVVWQKVDNSDAVTTVFGRLGNVLANQSDYSAFYPSRDGTAAYGSWAIDISGTATTAFIWGGRAATLNAGVTSPVNFIMIDSDGIAKIADKIDGQNYLNINNGALLNNNISGNAANATIADNAVQWGGTAFVNTPASSVDGIYIVEGGVAKIASVAVLKTALGI